MYAYIYIFIYVMYLFIYLANLKASHFEPRSTLAVLLLTSPGCDHLGSDDEDPAQPVGQSLHQHQQQLRRHPVPGAAIARIFGCWVECQWAKAGHFSDKPCIFLSIIVSGASQELETTHQP